LWVKPPKGVPIFLFVGEKRFLDGKAGVCHSATGFSKRFDSLGYPPGFSQVARCMEGES
jgi:hypothetical protein